MNHPRPYPFRSFLSLALLMGVLAPSAVRGVDYTDNLWNITDQGIFDEYGHSVKVEPPAPPAALAPVTQPNANLPTGDSFDEYQQSLLNNLGSKAYTQKRLQGVRDNLNSEVQRFQDLGKAINDTKEKAAPLEQEMKTLADQINLFNGQIRLTRQKISNAEEQIAERELDRRALLGDIKKSEVALNVQKESVRQYIALLYHEEEPYVDVYANGASTLKVLLADQSIGENMLGQEYAAVMEGTGRKVFHDMEAKYQDLQEKQAALLLGQTKMNRLYASLAQEKTVLEQTRQSKKEMLEKTQGEKETYDQLLEESIHQQLDSALVIQNLKDNMELIEGRLKELDAAPQETPAVPAEPATPEIPTFFDWPVPPNTITTYFHDPSYPTNWGVHEAIDIRALQFTPIHAPANGYVVEAKDNGFGYSYIILAHKHNFITVYGHVSEIRVSPGMLVRQGDVIGLTGGTPGTHGAGLQTTGPHLHFELHLKGDPVDPLDYLPVYQLPREAIPAKYLTAPQS